MENSYKTLECTFYFFLQERCTRTIITAYVGSILLCIPSFVTFGIEQQEVASIDPLNGQWNNESTTPTFVYKVNLNPIAQNYDGIVHKVRHFLLFVSASIRKEINFAATKSY